MRMTRSLALTTPLAFLPPSALMTQSRCASSTIRRVSPRETPQSCRVPSNGWAYGQSSVVSLATTTAGREILGRLAFPTLQRLTPTFKVGHRSTGFRYIGFNGGRCTHALLSGSERIASYIDEDHVAKGISFRGLQPTRGVDTYLWPCIARESTGPGLGPLRPHACTLRPHASSPLKG